MTSERREDIIMAKAKLRDKIGYALAMAVIKMICTKEYRAFVSLLNALGKKELDEILAREED